MTYWQVIFNIIQLLLTMGVWWSTRNKVNNDRFVQLENSKIALELELKHLKIELKKQRPACDNHVRMEDNDKIMFQRIENMHSDVRLITGTIGEIKGGLDSLKGLSAMINQFLMQGGPR